MKTRVAALIVGLLLGGLATSSVQARPVVLGRPSAKKGKVGKEPGPPEVTKKVKLSPDGLAFGITVEELSKLYDKVLDDEYVPLYEHTDPGPRTAELDAELADKKALILRHKLDFGSLPSGLDDTPLSDEYTYNNGESMTHLRVHGGVHRYFFFMGNRLWKVYDIHKLGEKSKLGADFDSAVAKLAKEFGKPPRVRKADPGAGRKIDQVDWQDKDTIVRALDYGGDQMVIAYIDRKTEEHLDRYRTHKASNGNGLDQDVSAVTNEGGPKPPNMAGRH